MKLSRKVRKAIAEEACSDAWDEVAEGNADEYDPEIMFAVYERLGVEVEWVRCFLAGELTDTSSVRRAQKLIKREQARIMERIGEEITYADRNDDAQRKREARKAVKKLRKQAKRMHAAFLECCRFWREWHEWIRDQDAAERLGRVGDEAE